MGLFDDLGLSGYIPDTSAPIYTQDYVPVQNIYGGVIQTKDERFIKIVEVLPVNIDSKSAQERDDIAHDFQSWLSVSPVNMQIKIMTGNSDPTKIINSVIERYNKDNDEAVYNLVKHYTELLNVLGNNGAVTKKFYLIISYEQKGSSKKDPTIQDIVSEMEETVATISSYFERMGNVILPLGDPKDPDSEQWAIIEFLYKLYNPRSCKDEFGRQAVMFPDRVKRVFNDKRKITKDPNASVEIDSLIAPMGIDTSYPDAVVIDGLYHSYLLISGDGYPSLTSAGWFSYYFSLAPGETVDMYIHKESKVKFLRDVSQKIKFTGLKLNEKNKAQMDYEQTEGALMAANYIKEGINNAGEDPFYLTTLLTITGYTYEDVIKRREQLIEIYKSRDINVLPLRNIQEESMRSAMPFMDLSPKLYAKGKRNLLSSGLASCYPFCAAEMNDDGGVMMGLDRINNTMCILNPFNQKAYKNANMVILGTSGAGKTYTEQLMALRMRAVGMQCFILAPDKAHEFQRASTYGVNGEFIKIAASSKDHINIMDIRPIVSEAALMLQGDAAFNTVLVSEKAGAIITFLSLLIPDLTNEEEQIIDTCVIKTYAKYGITDDNDSVYIDPEYPEKGLKTMPILGDLYDELKQTAIPERILLILSQFITGSAKSFNQRTNVNLDNKYIVFDLSGLQGRFLPAGMFVALNFIVGRIREDVTERKMVFIDEGWQLIGSGANEKAAEYVKWLFKIVRGYNGGACIATQDIQDFFSLNGGEYGNAILSNSQIKMLLNLSPTEAGFVQDQLKLSREEVRDIKNYGRGQCLICAGTNHISVNIVGSEYETDLITTNPDRVKKVVEKMKANGGKLV